MSVPPGTDLNTTPAGAPPPGQTSNLINPPSLQKTTIAVFSTLLAVATLFVVARVWFNVRHTRRMMLDDSKPSDLREGDFFFELIQIA
jgi:hypothetical protein